MFEKSARLYDALYSFKDYRQESLAISNLIREECPAAKTILDIACGTAEHDRYLAQDFQVDGLDISPDFIAIARTKNPAGAYAVADMTDFSLERRYDVILCLFSSIGYVRTIEKVEKSLQCMAAHLNDYGVLLLEPWLTPANWITDGKIYMLTAETDDEKICRMSVSRRKGSLSIIEFHYLAGSIGEIESFLEQHELGLFTHEEMMDAFAHAGLAAEYDPNGLTGRGQYIARKSATLGRN